MRVRWTRAALRQLDDIQDYIANDSRAAAHRVVLSLTTRVRETLGQFPESGRLGLAKGTREFVFDPLPYIVVYRVTDTVEVLAVVHAAKDRSKD